MHIHALICFGARPGEGNPALVVEGGDPSPEARQRLAHERDTTCVFIDEDGDGGPVRVDYWYPHMRSPLCLHATLAVAAVLFRRTPDASAITVETAMQGQRLVLLREGDDYFVRLAAQPAPQVDVTPEQAAALLGIAPGAHLLAGAPRVASVGSPKLLAEVRDAATLYALQPDLAWIAAWSKQHGVHDGVIGLRLARLVLEAGLQRGEGVGGEGFVLFHPRSVTHMNAAAPPTSSAGPSIRVRIRQSRPTARPWYSTRLRPSASDRAPAATPVAASSSAGSRWLKLRPS